MKTAGILLLAFALLTPDSLWAGTRFGIVIGNNRGQDAAHTLRYAERDADKFHQVLTELSGFDPDNLILLKGKNADVVWSAMHKIERRIMQQREKEQGGNSLLFVFYYSGHADGNILELGDSAIDIEELRTFLRAMAADVRLAFVDSCKSGVLVAQKGGNRGPAYEIQVADNMESSGYAFITSSAADEASQESKEIRGSFFTHYLVSALRGAGDLSSDGRVTLSEAYRYTYQRTVARTSASIGGGQHPMYDFGLSGQGEVVISQLESASAWLSYGGNKNGRLVVLNDTADALVAEINISAGKRVNLALPPGAYVVYLLVNDQAKRAQVQVHNQVVIDDSDFVAHSLEQTAVKGGLFAKTWRHRLGVGLMLRRLPLNSAIASGGLALHYRLGSPFGLQPVLRLTTSGSPDIYRVGNYVDLGIHGGLGWLWSVGPVVLRAEATAGYEHMLQSVDHHSSAFAYQGLAGLEIPLGELYAYCDMAGGGRFFKTDGVVHRFDLAFTAGLGWSL